MGEYPGEPGESDAEFLARLDRQVEQAHRDIAAVYERARRRDVVTPARTPADNPPVA